MFLSLLIETIHSVIALRPDCSVGSASMKRFLEGLLEAADFEARTVVELRDMVGVLLAIQLQFEGVLSAVGIW